MFLTVFWEYETAALFGLTTFVCLLMCKVIPKWGSGSVTMHFIKGLGSMSPFHSERHTGQTVALWGKLTVDHMMFACSWRIWVWLGVNNWLDRPGIHLYPAALWHTQAAYNQRSDQSHQCGSGGGSAVEQTHILYLCPLAWRSFKCNGRTFTFMYI